MTYLHFHRTMRVRVLVFRAGVSWHGANHSR